VYRHPEPVEDWDELRAAFRRGRERRDRRLRRQRWGNVLFYIFMLACVAALALVLITGAGLQ
jgi:hypothetical protein